MMLPVTPHQLWLAVVITTSISYFGYVLQTYLVPRRGLLLTGLIGGVYSSTAAVMVIARKSKETPSVSDQAAIAILFAVAMMYLRLLALVAIFRFPVIATAMPPLLIFAAAVFGYGFWLSRRTFGQPVADDEAHAAAAPLHKNPLELTTALVYALMFAVIAILTKYTLDAFRDTGLRVLSFVVGFSDITPFVVSVLQGNLGLSDAQVVQAIIIASASNNVLKTTYTWGLSSRRTAQLVTPALVGLALVSSVYAIVLL